MKSPNKQITIGQAWMLAQLERSAVGIPAPNGEAQARLRLAFLQGYVACMERVGEARPHNPEALDALMAEISADYNAFTGCTGEE